MYSVSYEDKYEIDIITTRNFSFVPYLKNKYTHLSTLGTLSFFSAILSTVSTQSWLLPKVSEPVYHNQLWDSPYVVNLNYKFSLLRVCLQFVPGKNFWRFCWLFYFVYIWLPSEIPSFAYYLCKMPNIQYLFVTLYNQSH